MTDREREMETILRWDRDTNDAQIYTADPIEMRRWQKLGYPVAVMGAISGGKPRSWQATVPIVAIALLPLKAGTVQVSRYLAPPTIQDRTAKAQEPREPKNAREIVKEIGEDFPAV